MVHGCGQNIVNRLYPFSPNPPKGYGGGVDTGDDGYGKANGPGPVPIDGVEGSGRWPRQWPGGGRRWWRPAVVAAGGGGGRRKRPGGRPEVALAGWAGMSLRDSPRGCPVDGSGADGAPSGW